MPELPEVEVVRRTLLPLLKHKRIESVECLYPPIIEDDMNQFKKLVEHKRIIDIQRYAKYLIFILEDGAFLSHLRMEGKYFYVSRNHEPFRHIHVIFHLDNGFDLLYQDVRKFGRIKYKQLKDIYTTPPLQKLGVEANVCQYDIQRLYERIVKRKNTIKEILLDQSIISGLGNIYADEVLFASRISPFKKGFELEIQDVKNIMDYSMKILNQAIEDKGTTIRSYTSSLGVEGNYQNRLCVHTKTYCAICNAVLCKSKIGGRTSYYCKNCQR